MSHIDIGFKINQIESLYSLQRPTWADYEPNFETVFGFAQNGLNGREVLTESGLIVARVWDDQQVFGLKKWMRDRESNAAVLPILVKNPDGMFGNNELVGMKNGLAVVDDTALALRITSGGRYVVRPVNPEYQEMFVQNYQFIMNHYAKLNSAHAIQ